MSEKVVVLPLLFKKDHRLMFLAKILTHPVCINRNNRVVKLLARLLGLFIAHKKRTILGLHFSPFLCVCLKTKIGAVWSQKLIFSLAVFCIVTILSISRQEHEIGARMVARAPVNHPKSHSDMIFFKKYAKKSGTRSKISGLKLSFHVFRIDTDLTAIY